MRENADKSRLTIKEFALKYGIYIGFVLVFTVFAVTREKFLTVQNLINILDQYAYFIVCAMGMYFVVMVGGVDLSSGGLIALSSVIGAAIMTSTKSALLGCAVVLVMCTLAGIINGMSVAKLGLPAFIATLAFENIWRGTAYTYTSAQTLSGIPSSITSLYFTKMIGIRLTTLIMIGVFIILFYLMTFTGYSKKLYAVGGNKEAAKVMGIKATIMMVSAYAICGCCSGISSVLLVSYMASASASVASSLSLDCIAAVIIGGASANGGEGKLTGAVVGALLFAMIKNGLNLMGLSYFYQLVATGVIIYIACAIDRQRVKAGL
ncbi:MAG: ABC transporter permease [Clostridiales bacterium]|nr:ABC transporter permease [Clostridiales bacterium]